MTVLQINATYANGSTGTIVQDLQQSCEENGIECHVAYAISRIPQSEIKNGYKIGNIVSNKLHALLCRINGKQAYFSYLPTLKLLRYINKIRPDVVHLHNLHSNYVNLNMLLHYLGKRNIATVVTLHDCWFFTGGCFHYTNVHCYRWLTSCGNCPKKLQDTKAYFMDKSKQILEDRYKGFVGIKNLTVVGVSKWISEESAKTVFRNAKVVTIYNGVDMNIFKPTPSKLREKYGIEDKYVVLGPAGKWLAPINREVFKIVTDGLPSDMVLCLFGCEQNQLLPKNVISIGFTHNKEELAKLYSMADVFVNCTREDTLPFINIEAQACGTPVITFANTGATETVHDIHGVRIETGNAEAMLAAIINAKNMKTPEVSSVIIEGISNEFNKSKNYLKYLQLFDQIV